MIEKGSIVYSNNGTTLARQYVYYLVLGARYEEDSFEYDFNNYSIEPNLSDEDKIMSCLRYLCRLWVVPIGMFNKNTNKELLMNVLKYVLQNSILARPLDTVNEMSFSCCKENGLSITEKEIDLFLLKSKMAEQVTLDATNSISVKEYENKLEKLIKKRFAYDITNTKKTIQYKTRHMYIYQTKKVFRLYYCAAVAKDGKYLFCCVYNQSLKDGSPDNDKIRKIVSNMQGTRFLNKLKIKPRVIENKELLEINGVEAPIQALDYYYLKSYFSDITKRSSDEDVY